MIATNPHFSPLLSTGYAVSPTLSSPLEPEYGVVRTRPPDL